MRRTIAISLAAALLGAAVLALPASGSSAGASGAGGSGLGDPFFPHAGNGGYNVGHYGIALAYRPATGGVRAKIRIKARALKRLSSFNLDYRGPAITSLEVGGRAARFRRHGQELIVKPARPIDKGDFRVVVRYSGVPRPVIDPDKSSEGWIKTDDGVFVVGEPQGSPSWFPSNDNPTDKATYTIRISVPRSLTGVSNGRLVSVRRTASRRSYLWRESQPMATYLATVNIGRGRLEHGHIGGVGRKGGVPYWNFVDPREAAKSAAVIPKLGRVLRFESRMYGPYPFNAAGNIVDHGAGLGYSLETQTRPIYDGTPNLVTLVHEQAHQWFGDSVSVATWPNIWLNEGFATYTEWLWRESHGGTSARGVFRKLRALPAKSPIWNPPPGKPGEAANLFATSIYVRGAMTLEAVRLKVGKKALLRIMRRWATIHRYGNGTVAEFTKLAEKVSGKQLDGVFETWLYHPGKPGASSSAAPAVSRRSR